MMLVEPTVTTFKWTELLPLLTPATLTVAIWKVRGWIDDIAGVAEDIHVQTSNHIPTLLTSIDKNIALLVDRTK
jgi:hypothetical protein